MILILGIWRQELYPDNAGGGLSPKSCRTLVAIAPLLATAVLAAGYPANAVVYKYTQINVLGATRTEAYWPSGGCG